jgi:hypothetical protein
MGLIMNSLVVLKGLTQPSISFRHDGFNIRVTFELNGLYIKKRVSVSLTKKQPISLIGRTHNSFG